MKRIEPEVKFEGYNMKESEGLNKLRITMDNATHMFGTQNEANKELVRLCKAFIDDSGLNVKVDSPISTYFEFKDYAKDVFYQSMSRIQIDFAAGILLTFPYNAYAPQRDEILKVLKDHNIKYKKSLDYE